ncbi:uncharacterized protein F4822DRAFT_107042 [Hypoxylon trugodes]|uniref:uncharacterized protein n=1 Tax=Hypoxylon trugodes TaxID=326681 RepID=UPI002193F659|nr:uncharacterized protein F4822DRAFT_107042 [Hypoxylon trugodes]KAI1391847.1 hypothetical protein F4822DRAFT_107042 [Hypoxylon trugodes]
MTVTFTTSIVPAGQEQSSIVRRQVTLTQTITYPDSTSTAVVTLDRGGPTTTSAAPSWSAGATSSSDGLGQQEIGIIVGCCLGAVVLGILLWCCCTRRCGCTPYSVYQEDDDEVETIYETDEIAYPDRVWRFPRSITPPVVPTYVATDTGPEWTAYQATRRDRNGYYWSQ